MEVSMQLKNKKIGVVLTGSFCTFEKAFQVLTSLVDAGAVATTIFSPLSTKVNCRFGEGQKFLKRAEDITHNKPFVTIEQAEAIGPKKLFDALLICPCTGNTMAKLAHGITDSPALMAAKAHLRNERPLVISLATNDALGMNLKNIGLLMNVKNIYFVPFGQDDPEKKTTSMIAHTQMALPTLEHALDGIQYQPVIQSPFASYYSGRL